MSRKHVLLLTAGSVVIVVVAAAFAVGTTHAQSRCDPDTGICRTTDAPYIQDQQRDQQQRWIDTPYAPQVPPAYRSDTMDRTYGWTPLNARQ